MIPHLVVAEAGRLRAADLCRRRLWAVEPRAERCSSCSAISATIWRCWRAPVALAALALAWTPRWRTLGARCRAHGRAAPNAGVNASQALNVWIIQIVVAIGPPLGALDLHGLYEDRLGNLAVLPDAAGAGRDSRAAPAKDGAVRYRRDLARRSRSRRLPPRPISRRARWPTIPNGASGYGARSATGPRADGSLAYALPLAMGGGRRHHRDRRADDVLQSRSSGAAHAGRNLVVGTDLAGGGQAARLHRHLRYHRRAAAGLRGWMAANAQECRAAGDHDAALLPRPSRARRSRWKVYIVPPAK